MGVRLKKYDDSRGTVYIRSILVFGNLFFSILGAAVIGVGIYLIVERVYFFEFVYGTQLAAASCYLIITAGVFMFLISFIGCYGTLFENGKLLLLYSFVLLLIFMVAVIGATLAIVFSVWVSTLVKIYMQESLMTVYGTNMPNKWNNLVTRCWDEVQEKFECCAIEDYGWSRYRQTFWYRDQPGLQEVDKPYVPPSCCKKSKGKYVDLFTCQMNLNGPPGKQSGPVNRALHYRGCFEAGKTALYPIVGYFIGIGFSMSAVVVVGIVMSLMMYSRL